MSFDLTTNLAEIPFETWRSICTALNSDNIWKKVALSLPRSAAFRPEENLEAMSRLDNPSEKVMRHLSNLGYSVKDFMVLLDRRKISNPQLLLKRKFQPVRISKQPELKEWDGENGIKLTCEATGFPYPNYQWFCDEMGIRNGASQTLTLSRCSKGLHTN